MITLYEHLLAKILSMRLSRTAIAFLTIAAVNTVHAGPPSAPKDLRISLYSSTAAEIFWARSSDDEPIASYEVSLNGDVVELTQGISYFTNQLNSGISYDTTVVAIDNDGVRSAPSHISFNLSDRQTQSDTEPLVNPPENVIAIVYSSTAAEIFWDRPPEIPRSYEISSNGDVLNNTTGTSAYLNQLDIGTEYELEITAIDGEGNRSHATHVVFTTNSRVGNDDHEPSGITDGVPPAPRNVSFLKYSRTAGELFWDRPAPSEGVVKTEVYREGVFVAVTDGTSFFDDTRESDVAYTYQLVALNADALTSEATIFVEQGVEPSGENSNEVFAALESDIVDSADFYQQDGYDSVDVLRVDIKTNTTKGTCQIDDQSGCTLDDIIADVDGDDDFKVEIPIHFQAADFANDGSNSNATLRQRGNTARKGSQKSFRIKLDSKNNLWRNERRLQLNKHPFEQTRIRNKLSFDLMQELPHLPSLRTQFVNLWIDNGSGAKDYGLFTHVEFAGKEYLANRGRDTDDNLYKVEFFQFSESSLKNLQVDENGKPLDEDRFESNLSIERGDDHRALVEMLTAVNDPNADFNTTLDQYFNRNNVLMWITANLLLHQTDAMTHNFYLYNPAGTTRFYFLPWDYDGTFHPESNLTNSVETSEIAKRLTYGYARGAYSKFVSQYYRLPGVHQKILDAAELIRNTWLTDAVINEKATQYRDIVEPYMTRLPDSEFVTFYPRIPEAFATYVSRIHENMQKDFDIPMPPTIQPPVIENGSLLISWEPAFDVTRSTTLIYDLELSSSVDFFSENLVMSEKGIVDSPEELSYAIPIDALPGGPLYARVIARASSDPENKWQIANNRLQVNGATFFGIIEINLP